MMILQKGRILGEYLTFLGLFHVPLQGQEALDPGSLKYFILEFQEFQEACLGDALGLEGPQNIFHDLDQGGFRRSDQQGPDCRAADDEELGPLHEDEEISPFQEEAPQHRNQDHDYANYDKHRESGNR
jgi:hypothetical protein